MMMQKPCGLFHVNTHKKVMYLVVVIVDYLLLMFVTPVVIISFDGEEKECRTRINQWASSFIFTKHRR